MKLIFPNGEHEQITLKDGLAKVGSAADCQVMLTAPGIAAHHCEILVKGEQGQVRLSQPGNAVVLNGKQLTQEMPLKPGDLLLFGKVGCRVAAVDRVAQVPTPSPKAPVSDEDGRTKVRMALPKYVLRGVSGSTFGKTFGLQGSMVIGRHSECDISIPSEEISRKHARLQVTPDGIMVEDMGSANGTYINDKRTHQGLLKPGEELRLDTVRFLLFAPGMEAAQAPAATPAAAAKPAAKSGSSALVWVVVLLVLAGATYGVLKYLGYA